MSDSLASPHCDISKLEDGDELTCVDGYCDLCNWTFGGSFTIRRAIHFQGKFYHQKCYPTAVNVYLTTKKLEKAKKKK